MYLFHSGILGLTFLLESDYSLFHSFFIYFGNAVDAVHYDYSLFIDFFKHKSRGAVTVLYCSYF